MQHLISSAYKSKVLSTTHITYEAKDGSPSTVAGGSHHTVVAVSVCAFAACLPLKMHAVQRRAVLAVRHNTFSVLSSHHSSPSQSSSKCFLTTYYGIASCRCSRLIVSFYACEVVIVLEASAMLASTLHM